MHNSIVYARQNENTILVRQTAHAQKHMALIITADMSDFNELVPRMSSFNRYITSYASLGIKLNNCYYGRVKMATTV